jgi:hypothetical protein
MASWEEFSRIVAEAKAAKKLDPVGKEDEDVNNDDKVDSTDSYLKARRATVGDAIAADKKKKSEKDSDEMCEAKVDEKLPEHERATARDKRSGYNLPGSGTRRVRRAEHEERRGKPKRWWDDDGDGIGYEKGEVKKESVEQIDEIAPLVAAGLAAGGAALAGAAINRAKKAADSGVTAANKGQNIKNPGTGIAGAAYGMQKRNNALNAAMQQLRQSYQPEGEYIEEMPYQVYGSHDGKTEKKIGKPVKSRKYAHDRADELSDTHKETGGKFRVQKEENDLDEGMTMKDFKQQRSRQKQKDKRETEKTSPLRRAGIHDDKASPERAARHRANVDPDFEGNDERNYPGGKLKDPKKIRKAHATGEITNEEHISEMSVSRAQQRFMGMVRAEQEGKMKGASPAVKAAAKSMTTQQAHDFAATKHAGLPERKETKEELSLVDRILAEASEAQIMAAKARREELAKKQKARLKKAKLSVAANKALKDEQTSDDGGGKEKENKPKLSAAERAAERVASGRIEVANIQRETEREKESARTERQRRSFERSDAKEAKAKRQAAEEEKKRKKKQHRSELKQDVKNAWRGDLKVASSEKDTDVADAMLSNIGKFGAGVVKTGVALGKYGVKRTLAKRQGRKENQKEEFSNWREEFIFEVDDQTVQNEKEKVIDVSKKKKSIQT